MARLKDCAAYRLIEGKWVAGLIEGDYVAAEFYAADKNAPFPTPGFYIVPENEVFVDKAWELYVPEMDWMDQANPELAAELRAQDA